jgi:hypothetical protein
LPLDVAIPAALLPVGVLLATHAAGGGIAQAQVAFVLSGSTAVIVDKCHLAAYRRARAAGCPTVSGPIRAAGFAAAGCTALTALLIPVTHGYIAHAAGTAAVAEGLLAAGLLAPGLPDAAGRARDVAWRLLSVGIAGAVVATSTIAWLLVAGAVTWWIVSRITHAPATRNPEPAVRQLDEIEVSE